MNKLWSEGCETPDFEKLTYSAKTDVLIIGGGMAGVLCALFLKRRSVDYMLIESGKIGGGITQNTTAKITSQHGLIYDKLIKSFGAENAALYLQANENALAEYRLLCRNTDCDFENKSSFVYCLDDEKKVEKERDVIIFLNGNTGGYGIIKRVKKMAEKYNKKLKQIIAYEICEKRRSTSKVAEEYGIPKKTVEKWVTAYNKDKTVFDPSTQPDKRRINELEKELNRLKRDNEILKKTLVLFAKRE